MLNKSLVFYIIFIFIVILIFNISFIESVNYQNSTAIQREIKQIFSLGHGFDFFRVRNRFISSWYLTQDIYIERDFRPIWVDKNGITDKTEDFISLLNNSYKEGLMPMDYHILTIKLLSLKKNNEVGQNYAQILASIDVLLTDAFFIYISDLDQGRIDYEKKLKRKLPENSYIYKQILKEGINNNNLMEKINEMRPQFNKYNKLVDSLNEYRKIRENGGWPVISPGTNLNPGNRSQEIVKVRERLKNEPNQMINLEIEDEKLFDDNLRKAIINFQIRYGLSITGIIDSQTVNALNRPIDDIIDTIKINLDRFRWLSIDSNSRYILVNIPAFKLEVIENDNTIMEMNIIIGKEDRPTPVFSEKIKQMVFNPRWYIPHSIAVNDYLPEVKKDTGFLKDRNIRVYKRDNSGYQEVNPDNINWERINENNFNYFFWQDSGPWNALGNVIFHSPNPYQVYLHDTPETHLFYRQDRRFSSGCVRIEKPLKMAEYLLKEDPDWNKERIDQIVTLNNEIHVPLPQPFQLHLIYLTAWVDENKQLNMRKDIYGYDKQVKEIF